MNEEAIRRGMDIVKEVQTA